MNVLILITMTNYNCEGKIKQLTDKYKELSDISGLPTKVDRLRVDGYRKVNINKPETLSLDINSKINNKVSKTFVENIKGQNFVEKIKKYESKIFKNDHETAIIIEENGDVYKFHGSNDYVNIDCNYKNAIITHNHPTFKDEIGGSFSEEDFKLLVNHQNIKQLRAVDEKYTYVTNVLKKVEAKDYKNALMKVIPLESEDFKHLIFTELQKEGLVEYERTIRK